MSGSDHCCKPEKPSDGSVVGMAAILVRLSRDTNPAAVQPRISPHSDSSWLTQPERAQQVVHKKPETTSRLDLTLRKTCLRLRQDLLSADGEFRGADLVRERV